MDNTEQIIEIEYRMFDHVNQGKARASCQDDKATFYAMRRCQFSGWNEEMKNSYLDDLKKAEEAGINLIAEKYAYMMKYTSPKEYKQIKGLLQPVSEEKVAQVNRIVCIAMDWTRQLNREYPNVTSGGRSLEDDQASRMGGTSIITYLRGELLTYSENTLEAYISWQQELLEKGENMNRIILEETVKYYGFTSLEEAETHCKV